MSDILIVDRIEKGCAICEDSGRGMHEIPLDELPKDVREGDVVRKTDEGYRIDPDETARRRERNKALFARLKSREGHQREE